MIKAPSRGVPARPDESSQMRPGPIVVMKDIPDLGPLSKSKCIPGKLHSKVMRVGKK